MLRDPVHILGIGNLGKLIAHSLRKYQPETPVTLLFHRAGLVQEWKDAGQQIDIVRNGQSDPQHGFNYEVISTEQNINIKNLVVATKTYTTADALRPLKDRLDHSSTMLFVQNGIGTIDEVTSKIFNQTSKQPKYLAGIVSHGLFKIDQFSSTHAGVANMVVGPVVANSNDSHTKPKGSSTAFFEQQLLGCPSLNMSLVSPQQLLYAQLQKLAVNAVINPLSVVFDRLNGELFQSPEICTLMQVLIAELSTVMTAIIKAKGDSADSVALSQFSAESLEKIVFDVGAKTARNISSMRQDVLAGRRTEIDYMNGYIIAQAVIHGVPCSLNSTIVDLVNQKKVVQESQINAAFGI
jgi:2-dehydropantoate 2-reductase